MTRGGPRLDQHRRRQLAQGYLQGSERYDRVRPGYPLEAVDWLVPKGSAGAADIGAGTGKFTRALVDRGLEVVAVDPSTDMLAILRGTLPEVRTVVGTAESTGLETGSVDFIVIAQAWHWCDAYAAGAEATRILVAGGRLGLVWNQLDVSLPWVHRLSRIMHAGDVFRPEYRPDPGPTLAGLESHVTRWTQSLTTGDIVDLAKSRSYYQNASETTRRKVEGNLDWYLHEHLGFSAAECLDLPYFTHSWRAHTG
ncbi:class I SAM-dependent methyltransferase [Arthrobacter sp. H5]|uniref:class I SAM-dependent methyltransferase n=1 Tax=Arthrobacter sp. H5 TaxID=1267973 RepID=UPI00047FBE9D|nr:class I SAM-dependent methyltransferase [Arthrobacter sp. H5]